MGGGRNEDKLKAHSLVLAEHTVNAMKNLYNDCLSEDLCPRANRESEVFPYFNYSDISHSGQTSCR